MEFIQTKCSTSWGRKCNNTQVMIEILDPTVWNCPPFIWCLIRSTHQQVAVTKLMKWKIHLLWATLLLWHLSVASLQTSDHYFLTVWQVIVLIFSIIKTFVISVLAVTKQLFVLFTVQFPKRFLSPVPSVMLSPCHCQPLCEPWQGADCHLPPLMHVDLPAAAFHLTVGSFMGRVLHMWRFLLSPHTIYLHFESWQSEQFIQVCSESS